jgi:hypothetical protein
MHYKNIHDGYPHKNWKSGKKAGHFHPAFVNLPLIGDGQEVMGDRKRRRLDGLDGWED